MRLRTRVFITLLSVSVVLVLTMAGLFQFGFERGLDRFLNERRQALLSEIATDLSGYYSERGNFDDIGLRLLIWAEEDDRNRVPNDLVLLDAERMPLFGPELPEEALVLYPVEVSAELVGWVGVPGASRHRDRLARNFRDSQIETLIRIILPALLLALIGTWWLSRQLLLPIEQSAALARRLSDGEYQARLPEQRDDELGELIRSMNRLAHSLAESSTARERWLADISHELRTPVAVLQGELEALVDGFQQLVGVGAAPVHRCRHQLVVEQARIGRLRRVARQAGIEAGTDAVDVGPRPQPFAVVILLGRGKTGGIHGLQLGLLLAERLPRRAEVDQHGRAIQANV